MADLNFLWQGVLHYRKSRLSAFEDDLKACSESLDRVEQNIEELNRKRLRLRVDASGGGEPKARIEDLWMQMLSLHPKRKRLRRRAADLAARRYRAERHVAAIEHQRQRVSRKIVPLAAG